MSKKNPERISPEGAKRDLFRQWHQKSSRDNIDEPGSSIDTENSGDGEIDGDSQQISIRIREFIQAELELYFGKG